MGIMRLAAVAVAGLMTVACQTSSGSGGAGGAARLPGRPAAHRPAATGAGSTYGAALSDPLEDPYYPSVGTTSVDALHYGLALVWHPNAHRLVGTETLRFRAPVTESAVSLDLSSALTVSRVTVDGANATYTSPQQKLDITTGEMRPNTRHTLVITYAGKPRPAAAPTTRSDVPDVGWTNAPGGQAWTIQEPYGAFTWYPVNDHPSDKAFSDVSVTTPKRQHAVSNGRLRSDVVTGRSRTMRWHLASPAAAYLVTLAIGPYREFHQTGPHGLPITYWVRPHDVAKVLPTLRRSPEMLHWLEARLGRFPFDRIGDVVVPTASGEETQTMVTIGAKSLATTHDGPANLLHEYSHQWYGDEVTPNNWPDLWMNESFATYFQFRWAATHGGTSLARIRTYLNADDQMLRNKYGPPGAYKRNQFASTNVYFCGARMLDRLDQKLGPKVFATVLRGWPRRERFKSADRAEWISYLDRTTGRDLKSFVLRWLDSKRSPR